MFQVVSAMPHDCPRCGAPLPPPSGGRAVCKYCRNTVHVDVSKPKHPAHRQAGAVSWLRREWIWAGIIAVGVGAWKAQRILTPSSPEVSPTLVPPPPPPPPTSTAESQPSASPSPQGVTTVEGRPLLVNAINPQAQDCVAVGRVTGDDDTARVFAFNGRTGRVLWQHALTATRAAELELAAWDDSVLVRTQTRVSRLRAEDGALLWSIDEVPPAGRLCWGSSYVAVVDGAPPSTGWEWTKGSPTEVKPGGCEVLYSTKDPGSNFQYIEAEALVSVVPATNGFTPLRALLPNQGNARVVLGEQTTDGNAAQLGVVVNRRWVWRQELSPRRFATYPSPAVASVRRGSVVVPYVDTHDHKLRLAAFALEQGRRQWDQVLLDDAKLGTAHQRSPKASTKQVDVVISLDGAVFVRTSDGQLRAYSLESGAPLWSIGGARTNDQ